MGSKPAAAMMYITAVFLSAYGQAFGYLLSDRLDQFPVGVFTALHTVLTVVLFTASLLSARRMIGQRMIITGYTHLCFTIAAVPAILVSISLIVSNLLMLWMKIDL